MEDQSECQTLQLPRQSHSREESQRSKKHFWPSTNADDDSMTQGQEEDSINTQASCSINNNNNNNTNDQHSKLHVNFEQAQQQQQQQVDVPIEQVKNAAGLKLEITQSSNVNIEVPLTMINAPLKKKREFNLFLPVAVIEKQEKEIPLATDGNSQKKNKSNIFTFYDNFHEYTVFCDVAMKKCSRESQQDRFSAINPLDSRTNNDAFFAVFDGHGTSVIADTLKELLHGYILESDHYPTNIERAVKESFSRIDSEILAKQKENTICSGGSTALCCLIKEDQLYIINCGDSSCVLVDDSYSVKFLNKLHKPSDKEEQERLLSKNTLFTQSRVIGTLAVTRAIGDYQHKEYIISEPDVTAYTIDHTSKYCFLGTDGFWDIIDYEKDLPGLLQRRDMDEEVSESVENRPLISEIIGGDSESNDIQTRVLGLKDLSTFLVEHASTRTTSQKKDNMTLLAIDLAYFYRQYVEMKSQQQQQQQQQQLPDAQDLLFNDGSQPAENSFELISNQIHHNNSSMQVSSSSSQQLIQSQHPLTLSLQSSHSSQSASVLLSKSSSSSSNSNGNLIVCQKSQFKINTQISSFLFQAKSPHSVGRNANDQKQQQQIRQYQQQQLFIQQQQQHPVYQKQKIQRTGTLETQAFKIQGTNQFNSMASSVNNINAVSTGGGALTCSKITQQKRSFFTFDDDFSMQSTAQSKNLGSQNAFTFLNQGSLLLEEKDPDEHLIKNIPECLDDNSEEFTQLQQLHEKNGEIISINNTQVIEKSNESDKNQSIEINKQHFFDPPLASAATAVNTHQQLRSPAMSAAKKSKPTFTFEF